VQGKFSELISLPCGEGKIQETYEFFNKLEEIPEHT